VPLLSVSDVETVRFHSSCFCYFSSCTQGSSGQPKISHLYASSRQSAPCNIDNFTVGNPRTWSVIFTLISHMFKVFFIYANRRQSNDVSPFT
jgi:hypothetical protein